MYNVQLLLAASGVFATFLLALWGITERNTSRLIDSFEKRMNDRDEKLLAKIDIVATRVESLRTEMTEKMGSMAVKTDALRTEMLLRFDVVERRLDDLQAQSAQQVFFERQVTTLTTRVDMLERRAA